VPPTAAGETGGSEIRKQAPDAGVAEWFASVPADTLFLSVLVVGEIRPGIEGLARRDPDQAEIFERWLDQLDRGLR
jgi:toxin FitB